MHYIFTLLPPYTYFFGWQLAAAYVVASSSELEVAFTFSPTGTRLS